MSQNRNGNKNSNGQSGTQSNKANRQRRFGSKNRNSKGSAGKSNNQPIKPTVRGMKYHMHGTDACKKAEIFGKIKEDIVSCVKRTFKDPLDAADSLKDLKEKTFKEPEMGTSSKKGDAKAHEEKVLQLKLTS